MMVDGIDALPFLKQLMELMREKGAIQVKAHCFEVTLSTPPKPDVVAPKKRELTDLDYALAASEGFPDEDDDPVSVPTQT